MTINRASILRLAVSLARTDGRSRGHATRDGATALTATSGAARSLVDSGGLPPVGASSATGKGQWLYLYTMAAAYQRRLIQSYDASSWRMVHQGPDYDATTIAALVAATCPYMILKDDPDEWVIAINNALTTLLSQVKYDTFTPTGAARYTVGTGALAALTGITRPSQIAEVEVNVGSATAGDEDWQPWANGARTWNAYTDEQTVILDFNDTLNAPSTGDAMRIKWTTQYAAATDWTTAIAVDERLAALATCVSMADNLADPNNPDDDWNVIGNRVREQYEARRRLILGSDAFRQVSRAPQQTGILRMRGRGGR